MLVRIPPRVLALVLGVAACAPPEAPPEAPADAPRPTAAGRALGGTSSLVAPLRLVAADTGVPAELLAALGWTETRLRADAGPAATAEASARIGLLGVPAPRLEEAAAMAGVSPADVAGDPEAGMRAAAALLMTPGARGLADYAPALAAYGGPALADAVRATLARGLAASDARGATVIVPAQPVGAWPAATPAFVPASTANYSVAARGAHDIDHIVIHDTEGSFAGTVSWFQDPAAQVSAHYVVRSADGHAVQMVHDKDIAWHDKCFNTHTIGVEHEGYQAHPDLWYTEAMYAASATLVAGLCDTYGIAKQHGPILGHGEAPDCSDHTDPGPGWDWPHYIDLVATGGAPTLAAADDIISAPARLVAGQVGEVSIALVNTGTSAWDVDATRLGTARPHDRASLLAGPAVTWPAPDRPTAVAARTAPGATGTFVFSIQAPRVAIPTGIDEAFQLVDATSGAWFGPELHVRLTVVPDDQSAPPVTPDDGGGCAAAPGPSAGSCAILLGGVAALRRRRRR